VRTRPGNERGPGAATLPGPAREDHNAGGVGLYREYNRPHGGADTPYLNRLLADLSPSAAHFVLAALRRAFRAGARTQWGLPYAAALLLRDEYHRDGHPDRLDAVEALRGENVTLAAAEALRLLARSRRRGP
jgi:hypothetical protein